MSNMSRRDMYIVAAVALVGVVAAFWFLALSPKRQEAAKLDKDVAAAKAELDQAKQEKVTFAQAQVQFPRMYASLGRLGKAVPPDEDVPSLLVQLNHAASQANVDFRSVELKMELAEKAGAAAAAASAAAPAPAEGATGASGATGATATAAASSGTTGAAGSTSTPGPTAAPAEFKIIPFEYKFEGSFNNLEKLLKSIDDFVDRRNQELAIAGRLITVQGFAMKRGKVTLVATTYMLPADQGLFAGATPQGPATTDPAAPQAASAGSATPAPPTAAVTSP
jgi:type IV pilus assembly PilO-like protein